jgi:integrase/plasmid maintenance system antidote protein VapI
MATVATSTALITVRAAPLIQVRKAETIPQGITVGELCDAFLRFKQIKVNDGELCKQAFGEYFRACERVCLKFGTDTSVTEITPIDFMEYRAALPRSWGASMVGKQLQCCRSLFRYGYEAALLDKPVRFGPSFTAPARRLFRRERREKGLQMFEAVEIRQMIEAANPVLRAMILLGINAGFGNCDCARLPFSALDLEKGFVAFPRPKTEVDRRCPLWPETTEALNRAIALRLEPNDPGDTDQVFITNSRRSFEYGEGNKPISLATRRLILSLGIERRWRNFYGLRRTFETIGGESLDQIAVNHIMGHVDATMAAVYRQRISDERLSAVTDYVRHWLFPDVAANYFASFRALAAAIYIEWEQLPAIASKDVCEALKRTKIKQCELARGIGFSAIWVSELVRGGKSLSSDAQMRIRAFFQQLSHGKTPTPLPKQEIPIFNSPAEVPLSEEAITALGHWPMNKDDLAILARCLSEFGITQVQLAAWWGHKKRYYEKMRYGERLISLNSANRLREMFGLPKVKINRIRVKFELGQLPLSETVRSSLAASDFDVSHLRNVLAHLRSLRIKQRTIEKHLGLPRDYFSHAMSHIRKGINRNPCQGLLRTLFAFSQTGGAE